MNRDDDTLERLRQATRPLRDTVEALAKERALWRAMRDALARGPEKGPRGNGDQ